MTTEYIQKGTTVVPANIKLYELKFNGQFYGPYANAQEAYAKYRELCATQKVQAAQVWWNGAFDHTII